MRVAAAILCDYAQVREGLLMMVSGGLTRLIRPKLPAPMGISLALVVEVPPAERLVPHELHVEISDGTTTIARVDGGFQIAGGDFDPDESGFITMPLDFHPAQVTRHGWHSVIIIIDGEAAQTVRFKVVPHPPQGQPPMARPPLGQPRTH